MNFYEKNCGEVAQKLAEQTEEYLNDIFFQRLEIRAFIKPESLLQASV